MTRSPATFTGQPLFDTADRLDDLADLQRYPSLRAFIAGLPLKAAITSQDYEITRHFLLEYSDVSGTFNRFRGEVQRFLNYLWVIECKTLAQVDHQVVTGYYTFIKTPPASWISAGIHRGFQDNDGQRTPNPLWRPFTVRGKKDYLLDQSSLNSTRTVLQTYFRFLMVRGYLQIDPMLNVRRRAKKAKPILEEGIIGDEGRRLSDLEWADLLETLMQRTENEPAYERHLFVVVTLKALFLRVGELAERRIDADTLRTPVFGDFKRTVIEGTEVWRFNVFGKGDKKRFVTAPDGYLPYLKRWRAHLGLTPTLPLPNDKTPILPYGRSKGLGARQLARIYTQAIDLFAERVKQEAKVFEERGMENECEGKLITLSRLKAIRNTTHFLRHTGASMALEEGVELRHVSEELGHSSTAFTEATYIGSDKTRRLYAGKKRRV